jgi:hypothetical protein
MFTGDLMMRTFSSPRASVLAAATSAILAVLLPVASSTASEPTALPTAQAEVAPTEEELPEDQKMVIRYSLRHDGERHSTHPYDSTWWVQSKLVEEHGVLDETLDSTICVADVGTGDERCDAYVHSSYDAGIVNIPYDPTWNFDQRVTVVHPGGPSSKPARMTRVIPVYVHLQFVGSPFGRTMEVTTFPKYAVQKVLLQRRGATGWERYRRPKIADWTTQPKVRGVNQTYVKWTKLPRGRYRAVVSPIPGRAGARSEVLWVGRPRR